MHFDWWTLVLQAVNLLVLVAILGRFLFRPMARIVADRQAEADRLLDEARAARDAAEAAAREAQARRDSVLIDRKAIVEEARKEAEVQRVALLKETEAEVARERSDAADQIRRLRQTEEARIGQRANALSIEVAGKLLEEPAKSLPLSAFLGGFERAIAAMPEASRKSLGESRKPLGIVSARPLDEADRKAVRAILTRTLGRDRDIAEEVDPALIAGLRIAAEGIEVDASLRAGLDRVAAALEAKPEHPDDGK
ncbi:MAG: F0F1 ATP synthase subunit delta [Sphingomonadales bacterium]|nr:F0F1 ATP synthase subunit delta [Sphingomonadales bacterium]MDE2568752.1 F0F1 ATP synthase subunit delta [Sphingomonadales bacterium]